MTDTQHHFGRRLRPKKEEPINWVDLVHLPREKMAFIYKRLSSYEQVRKSIYSIKAQDALIDVARDDGYPDNLIYVGERDLGISGTLGIEDRPELAYLIELVEGDKVESVYTVHISRLYRDQTLINAFTLGELFKEHNVIVVTPQMRLNLRDKMHMRLYRMEVERAADELEIMAYRMLVPKEMKAKSGLYAGEKLPTGYIVDERKTLEDSSPNPRYHSYLVHEPHAEVVRTIFELMTQPSMTLIRVARYCDENGITLAPFPAERDTPANRKTFAGSKRKPDGSWPITVARVYAIVSNPAYIGWRIWGGEVVRKDAFPPIIDEVLFWSVQERYGNSSKPKKDNDPLPLAGLLYCANHDVLRRMFYFNRSDSEKAEYRCMENDLRSYCCSITSYLLDDPICEVVVRQLTLPGLTDKVLAQLTNEYEQAKEASATYRREMKRLEAEVDSLRGNLASGVMSTEQLEWLDQQIQARLSRMRELADLEQRPIGVAVGHRIPGPQDIELVRSFLSNLGEIWDSQPNGLKNALLRLLLDRVIVWPEPGSITVRLMWRTGLEQELLIRRLVKGDWQDWTEAELAVIREHYEAGSQDDLLAMLPGRTWRAIKLKSERLGLRRTVKSFSRRGGKYTCEEDDFIRRYYANEIDLEEVTSATGRTLYSIQCRAQRLKVHRQRRVMWDWLNNRRHITQNNYSSRPG
jgi:DNA invertase Pin-like site-specific DNA recombinase